MSDSVSIIRLCVELMLLWAFWQFVWKPAAVDLLRQSLFPVRNRLFDMAMNREMGLDFNTPVYVALRQSFNSRIRFAHRVTFSHVWLTMLACKITGVDLKAFKPKVEVAIESVQDPALKAKLQRLKDEGDALFLRHLLLTSPLLLVIVAAVGWWTFWKFFLTASYVSAFKKAYQYVRARGLEDSKYVVAFQADCQDDNPQATILQTA